MRSTRRQFLSGCSAAIAAMAGARINGLVLAEADAIPENEILVVIFLRGGADVLNIVVPTGGDDRGYYEAARPDLRISLDNTLPLDTHPFGLNNLAAPLHDLYTNGSLAILPATGMHTNNRSHFDTQEFMELGTPGNKNTSSGWLTRHLSTMMNLPPDILVPAMTVGNVNTSSFLDSDEAIAFDDPESFLFNTGPFSWRSAQRFTLRRLYAGDSPLDEAGIRAMDASDIISNQDFENYVPSNGATYPAGSFGDNMKLIAAAIKSDIGVRAVTIDLGGWDTHEEQKLALGTLLNNLSLGLSAFYTDLDGTGENDYNSRVTTVVMSEFGRKLFENDDIGTDHGHGGLMLALGGNVIGGLYGDWPGLRSDQLFDGVDLAVTTDYRRVLSEILIRRFANPFLGIIFPDYANYAPIGFMNGPDIEPIYDDDGPFPWPGPLPLPVPIVRPKKGLATVTGASGPLRFPAWRIPGRK